MKIIFTGTSSGKTSQDRFHSSFIIQTGSFNLLVDAGDGISRALLNAGIKYNSISGIVFTHMHPDHSAGLPSLIVQMKMAERKDDLIIYCHKEHEIILKTILRSTLILSERLKFKLRFSTFVENEKLRINDELQFTVRLNSHLNDLKDDLESETDRISCSFLFRIAGRKVFYTGDILEEKDLYLFKDSNIDLMISESTHLETEKIVSAYLSLKASHLYLTHIRDEEKPESSRMDMTIVSDKFVINL